MAQNEFRTRNKIAAAQETDTETTCEECRKCKAGTPEKAGLDMKKMGVMEIASLVMQGADQGIAVFAPIFAEAMPGAVRVAYIQRVAALMAERAALLSRLCGDAQAFALANKQDVAEVHLAELDHLANRLRVTGQGLPHKGTVITTDHLAQAYAPPKPPTQAQAVMATKDGGL